MPESRHTRYALPAMLLVLGGLYAATLAPDLSWANGSTDGGDLITAAAVGGVPHPTGYPTYLLLAGQFQRSVPFGSLAFRTNLLSLVCALGAATALFFLIRRSLPASAFSPWIAAGASLFFGLSQRVWSQAVISEVYALHLAFIALLLWLGFGALSARRAAWLGVVFGLGLGNHVTLALLGPVLLVLVWRALRTGGLLRFVLATTAGLSVYLLLPLRAAQQPAVSWGAAHTFEGFAWLVSGAFYASFISFDSQSIATAIGKFARQAGTPYVLAGVLLALAGVRSGWQRQPDITRGLLVLIGLTVGFAVLYRSPDAWTQLLPIPLYASVFAAWGLQRLHSGLASMGGVWPAVGLIVLLAAVSAHIALTYPQVDASRDLRATAFVDTVASSAPPDALLLTRNDQQLFALWYAQHVLGLRPDLAIIGDGLYPQPWYVAQLAEQYPAHHFAVPAQETIYANLARLNPNRPLCLLDPGAQPVVSCYP